MGSESSADPPLCGEKPPELQLQATGYRSLHEKFTADINKSESKARHMIPATAFLVSAGRKAHSELVLPTIQAVQNERERSS